MPNQPDRPLLRFDLPFPSIAENLAADEALLAWCESGDGVETLSFWEPAETFVVVGYANKIAREVNLVACDQAGIPVYRRCSGGGTVVQMPGGLNYSLILRISETGPLSNITSANRFIMEKNRAALSTLLPQLKIQNSILNTEGISVQGHTDLCLGKRKFAGNSQRRRKHYLLFHGTLLLDCDLKLISRLLLMPSLEPDYRANRKHEEFVTNLNLPAAEVKTALAQAWHAKEVLQNPPLESITQLAREKYASPEWNYKF
jgi:lipoate-protein ligase A